MWAQVLKSKYCKPRRIGLLNRDKLPCSRIWPAMKKSSVIFSQGVGWTVCRHSSLNFWDDKWARCGVLKRTIQGPLPEGSSDLRIRDVVSENGWNWPFIPFDFPPSIKDKIQATLVAMSTGSNDKMMWKGSKNGNFDLKSAYSLASPSSHIAPSFDGK